MDIVFPSVFVLFFLLVLGAIAFAIIKGIARFVADSNSPVLTVTATVVSKRTEVSGTSNGPTSTWHYCTFETADGERQEFSVRGREYGMLVEGDRGNLTYQGSRYKGFQRQTRSAASRL